MLHLITKKETALPIFNAGICPKFYSQIVEGLLKKFYGVELNDTYLDDSFVIAQAIDDEMHPYEIVNEWANECGATKLSSSSWFESSLSLNDERTIVTKLNGMSCEQ